MNSQQALDFNIKASRENRDRGMKQAGDNAGKDWQERAFRFLKWYIHSGDPLKRFVIEDVRQLAKEKVSLSDPPHLRAWGSVAMRAVKEGLMRRTGYTQVKNEKAHRANCSVWQRV